VIVPDYCEPITGHRAWVASQSGVLYSLNGHPWPQFEAFRARCEPLRHFFVTRDGMDAPAVKCTCGIYAYKAPFDCSLFCVWGEVKLWGRVIEHAKGYRAEFAYPGRLYCCDKDLAALMTRNYGVQCIFVHGQRIAVLPSGRVCTMPSTMPQANRITGKPIIH
jgi:hypothetical protein